LCGAGGVVAGITTGGVTGEAGGSVGAATDALSGGGLASVSGAVVMGRMSAAAGVDGGEARTTFDAHPPSAGTSPQARTAHTKPIFVRERLGTMFSRL